MKLHTIGGDTDSLFLKADCNLTPDQAEEVSKIITIEMIKHLPPPLEIDFEAFAKRAIIFRKKRYCMWTFERSKDGWKDKLKMRGIETRRRDWCPLVGETMTKVLEMILKEGTVEDSRKYALDVINQVSTIRNINDQWDLAEKLVLSKQISRGFDDYSVEVPHVAVCRKMEARGETPYGLGDRVPYMMLPGALHTMISESVDTPEYIREHGGAIDVQWYVQRQLLPPLRRIFDAIGIDLLTGNKQKYEVDLGNFKETGISTSNPVNMNKPTKLKESGGLLDFI